MNTLQNEIKLVLSPPGCEFLKVEARCNSRDCKMRDIARAALRAIQGRAGARAHHENTLLNTIYNAYFIIKKDVNTIGHALSRM